MENRTPKNFGNFQSVATPDEPHNNLDLTDHSESKKKVRKLSRKNKPSPVMRLDEETLPTGVVSDNNTEDLSSDLNVSKNSVPEDEDYLIHTVLSKILNRKKMQLLAYEEVRQAVAGKLQDK